MTVFEVTRRDNDIDEIHLYEMGRYIRVMSQYGKYSVSQIQEHHCTVIHLSIHFDNEQRVYFTTKNATEQAAAPHDTTLTGFLSLCIQDDFTRTLLNKRVLKYYI